jgi:hypothetical protein
MSSLQVSTGAASRNWMGVRGVTHITESSSLTTTLFLQLIRVQVDDKLVIYFIELNLVDPLTFFEEIILPLFSYQFLMSPVAKNVQSTVPYLQFRLHCTKGGSREY